MIPQRSHRNRTLLLMLALVTASLVAAAPAVAHESGNHGTIKVHDDESVEPPERNQPHVSCEFWIEGFGMSDDSGHLVFEEIPPTADEPTEVLRADWTADAESDPQGWHFNAGPFELDPGHYRVYAYTDEPHPGAEEHFAKTKTFWVNECPPDGEEPPEVPCPPPEELRAIAQQDGSIVIEWGDVEDADAYRIYRAEEGGDFNSLAQVDGDTHTFTDTDTEIGVTYQYMVNAVVDGSESESCPIVEATAIPFFPGAAGLAIASLAAVGAYFGFRRRG